MTLSRIEPATDAAAVPLITAAIVIALYFLKLRHRRVFDFVLYPVAARTRRTAVPFALGKAAERSYRSAIAVTIALLIAMSLARPEIANR